MFDRMDKKKMWLVSKQIQRLLYLLVFLQKTLMFNQYIFIPKRITSILCKTNKPTTCIKYISARENIIKKIFVKTFLLFEICNMFLSCNANIAQWFLYDLYKEGVLCAVNQ